VLVAVFVPIAFLQGDVGRLFSEFAITMAAAVCFSSIVALSLSPMLASKILKRKTSRPRRRAHPHGPLFRGPSATATAVCSAAP
jgi:multidrug efflux pump